MSGSILADFGDKDYEKKNKRTVCAGATPTNWKRRDDVDYLKPRRKRRLGLASGNFPWGFI